MGKLSGKITLITGASSGIGRATAANFASLGCSLSITGRDRDNLTKTKELCLAQGLSENQVLLVVGDIAEEPFCRQLVDETVAKFGRLDVLVNNAGTIGFGAVEDTTLDSYDQMMRVNVRCVFLLTQLAIPHLKKAKGSIVNVSSLGGLRSLPDASAYCMSKAALDQFTRCAALELAADGVRVNSVNPGVIVTDIYRRAGMSDADYQQFLKKAEATHALGRPGTAEEVARSIEFLAGDSSTFTTGITLPVDGGKTQTCPR